MDHHHKLDHDGEEARGEDDGGKSLCVAPDDSDYQNDGNYGE
jgi:hypothetical protein